MPASLIDAPRLSFTQAAHRLGCHVATLHRWSQHGVGGVKLRATRIGGRSYVTLTDLDRFIAARSDPAPTADIAADRQARADAAGRQLDAMGL